jgi:hypothetical protein
MVNMTRDLIPADATFRHLTGSAPQRAEYIRSVLVNLEALGNSRLETSVRIGVAGKGVSPHYRFEAAVPFVVRAGDGTKVDEGVVQDTFLIYNGLNHKQMTAFEASSMRDEHWSSQPMSYEEVRAFLGEVRQEIKAK